jgi:nitroimidazol reductase NimA-like FMN-containing flavoprotein (pyridoxamine 5'-phosphate oxidase superfamily)
MEELPAATCWTLLRTAEVGRLAFEVGGQPEIFPVNFVVDGPSLVFRTAEGTKLAATVLDKPVAFEVDSYEPEDGRAWSVIAYGRAEEVSNFDELEHMSHLPLFPWSASPKNRFVRILVSRITGRRFAVVGRPAAIPTLPSL